MIGTKQPSTSLRKAAEMFEDSEMIAWLGRQKESAKSEVEYYDRVTPYYQGIMRALPMELRAIMDMVLRSYKTGIRPKEIAKYRFKSQQSISASLSRLRKAGLVKSRKEGRESYYHVDDYDFLGVTAIRDRRFSKFHVAHDRDPNCVSMFIEGDTNVDIPAKEKG